MKTLSAAVLCTLLTAQALFAQPAAPTTAPSASQQKPTAAAPRYEKDGVTPAARFMTMHEGFLARAKEGNVDLLFLGDSITAGWAGKGKEVWEKRYASRNAANFGIGGDRTQNVLWRIENGELDHVKPKVIVLMIGTNNTADNAAEPIAEAVTKIVRMARDKTGAKVLLLGVFPRGETSNETTAMRREKITRINREIAQLDDGKNVRFLDLKNSFMQADGTIAKEIMPDYLHLSPEGYAIWADAMEPLLSEMMAQ